MMLGRFADAALTGTTCINAATTNATTVTPSATRLTKRAAILAGWNIANIILIEWVKQTVRLAGHRSPHASPHIGQAGKYHPQSCKIALAALSYISSFSDSSKSHKRPTASTVVQVPGPQTSDCRNCSVRRIQKVLPSLGNDRAGANDATSPKSVWEKDRLLTVVRSNERLS